MSNPTGRRRILTDDECAYIVRRYLNDHASRKQIARELHTDQDKVTRVLADMCIELRLPVNRRCFNESERTLLLRYPAQTIRSLAAQLHTDVRNVSRELRRMGRTIEYSRYRNGHSGHPTRQSLETV